MNVYLNRYRVGDCWTLLGELFKGPILKYIYFVKMYLSQQRRTRYSDFTKDVLYVFLNYSNLNVRAVIAHRQR